MGAELLETALSAENDLIVDPALPLRGSLSLACAQGCGYAGLDEIAQDHERRIGNLDLPGRASRGHLVPAGRTSG